MPSRGEQQRQQRERREQHGIEPLWRGGRLHDIFQRLDRCHRQRRILISDLRLHRRCESDRILFGPHRDFQRAQHTDDVFSEQAVTHLNPRLKRLRRRSLN